VSLHVKKCTDDEFELGEGDGELDFWIVIDFIEESFDLFGVEEFDVAEVIDQIMKFFSCLYLFRG
jgi:hypothetical protein